MVGCNSMHGIVAIPVTVYVQTYMSLRLEYSTLHSVEYSSLSDMYVCTCTVTGNTLTTNSHRYIVSFLTASHIWS